MRYIKIMGAHFSRKTSFANVSRVLFAQFNAAGYKKNKRALTAREIFNETLVVYKKNRQQS